ncbi:MAG: PAS-domain containing protein [Pseudomonadota bacterium]
MTLLDPADGLERQNVKLQRIVEALMRRVEQSPDHSSLAYAQFERAALLETEVSQRTAELERALDLLHESNARLGEAMTEAEAARSNLAEAIETVQEGFALFDAEDRLVLHNSRFCLDFDDVKPALSQGLPFERYVDLVSRSRQLALPDGQTDAEWRAKRMRNHAEARTTFNVRLVRDRWVQVSEHRTGSGGTVILQTDVTRIIRQERRERDRLMDLQARMVRATLDHLAQGVAIFDRGGRILGWNAQMEALLTRPLGEEVIGTGFEALIERLDGAFDFTGVIDARMLTAWAAQRAPRPALDFEVMGAGDRAFTVFAQEMPDRGFVISFTDVTAERSATQAFRDLAATLERRVRDRTEELGDALEEARRANASKTRFMAAASHDLLQPLSAAKLFVGSLEERTRDPELGEIAGKALSALVSVEAIIGSLLDISKLDSGQAQFEVQDVPLATILDSLRIEMTPLAAARGLILRVAPSSMVVRSDPVVLRRVIQNLVSNAVRYTDGSDILLGVRRTGGAARIEVLDRGPGIAPDDQAVIFEEFRQLGPHRSGASGVGLGLAIVERACGMLGHRLALDSVPGRGSRFSVAVPMAAEGAVCPTAPAAPDAGRDGLAIEDLIVALVENDPHVARGLSMTIEGWGASVIQTASGEEALELLGELGILPDLFLVDYQLGPGMDGIACIGELRDRFGPVSATLISADRSADLARRCQAAGIPLMAKPPGRDALANLLLDNCPTPT